jgi:hypothetical protein
VAHEKRRRAQAKRLRAKRANAKRGLWDRSRSGSHAGRGFHYQHRVATEIALELLHAGTLLQVTPEGLEDLSLETTSRALHVQAKSRREGRGAFRASELRGVFTKLADRLVADAGSSVVLVLERPVADWPRLGEEVRDGRASISGGELIDFRTRIADDRFYAGVDALPGHVGAGLILGRPELTSSLLAAARDHGRALVVALGGGKVRASVASGVGQPPLVEQSWRGGVTRAAAPVISWPPLPSSVAGSGRSCSCFRSAPSSTTADGRGASGR